MENIRKAIDFYLITASVTCSDLVSLRICFATDYFLAVLNVSVPILA